jgi:hypothetical protein
VAVAAAVHLYMLLSLLCRCQHCESSLSASSAAACTIAAAAAAADSTAAVEPGWLGEPGELGCCNRHGSHLLPTLLLLRLPLLCMPLFNLA